VIGALRLLAQLAIVAHAPDSAQVCDAVDVTVAVSAPSNLAPRLTPPAFEPFDLLRATSSATSDGARVTSEYLFTLTTARAGEYVIPSFVASVDGQAVRSAPLHVLVRASRFRPPPAVIARARIDTSDEINLAALTPAETVYVGQQATYEVAVFLNQSARERLRRNPTFYPPEMQAMLAYDLPPAPPRGAGSGRRGSQCFDALVYRRALFPLIPGRVVIPPAQLVYSIGLSSTSLFSREESRELQTDSVSIVAVDPPQPGRPPEYVGAVGAMRVESHLDSASSSRVGDPVLFTVKVSGSGNVKLFPRPRLAIPWASVVAADERVRVDSTGTRVAGAKEFDWVLTPRIAGEFDVPPVRYGYFDPARARYDVAQTQPSHLSVGAGTLASADTGSAETVLAIRTRFRGESSPPLHTRPGFWFVLAIAPVPAALARMRRRRRTRVSRSRPMDPMRALVTTGDHAAADPSALRRQFVRVLAQRLGCSPEDFTHQGALDRALRRAGVSHQTSERAEALLRELDAAAYANRTLRPEAGRHAITIAREVDREALSRGELPYWIPAILLAAFVGIAAPAIAGDPASDHFARGVSAYLRDDYVVARDAFATAATLAPNAPDAWANFGTASWAVSDTAAAVYGWREALAMEPDAADVQQRVSLAHDYGMDDPGWVPDVARNAASWLIGLLWIAAWALAWGVVRSERLFALRRWPAPIAACAVLLGLASIELQIRVSGRQLGVVRHATAVVTDPAIGMDRGPSIAAGEMVRVLGRRGVWTRVESAAGRDGWIPSGELLWIGDRRVPSAAPRRD
jgi:hypothetical protein